MGTAKYEFRFACTLFALAFASAANAGPIVYMGPPVPGNPPGITGGEFRAGSPNLVSVEPGITTAGPLDFRANASVAATNGTVTITFSATRPFRVDAPEDDQDSISSVGIFST